MKRIATLALTIAALATPAAEAALIDRGNGLIYDSSQIDMLLGSERS